MERFRIDPDRAPTGRPRAEENAPYQASDIDQVPGDDAVEALARAGDDVLALLEGLDDAAVAGVTYAPGKWTLKQVIGHLIDDERIFAYRALSIARGEAAELPGFDENGYAFHAAHEERSLASLRAEYCSVRASTLALFENLPRAAWDRRGRLNGYEATVRGLAFHIAAHERRHLRALRELYLPRAR